MTNTQEIVNMPVDSLNPDKLNPRQEFVIEDMIRLEESISKRGILNPLLVEPMEDGTYLIVDGERRYRVAKRLDLKEVPVRITESLTDKDRLLVRFNLQEVHSPWTAWDKSVAIGELNQMTGWNTTEMARQLGVSNSTVSTLLSLQKLSKRTISIVQKAKLPTVSVARISNAVKNMEPEKSFAIEEAYVAGVESGKIFDNRTSNKFLIASKRATVAQLNKYGATKKYAAEDILKENKSEHKTTESNLQTNLTSSRSAAKRLSQHLVDNKDLLVEERTVVCIESALVSLERLIKIIGKRVEAAKK